MSHHELQFKVLGPLAVSRGDGVVALGGRRQRLVLAMLLANVGRVVTVDHLLEAIWGADRPTTGTGPVRTYVWQLRRLLTPRRGGHDDAPRDVVLVSHDGGYLLDVDPHQIDGVTFERHVAGARTAAASDQPDRALASIDDALGLWRGPTFGDLATEPALRLEAARLDELLLEARELRCDLLLATGRHAQAASELGATARAHPERERLWALLMTALYRSGRQSEALRCFQEARTRLVDTMGIEPGPELRGLELAILRQDPALDGHR